MSVKRKAAPIPCLDSVPVLHAYPAKVANGNGLCYILGEVLYRIGKVKGAKEAEATLSEIRRLAMASVPATDEAVLAAARIKTQHAISCADAFAAAAARALDAVLVTGDPELVRLGERVRIEKLTVNREE